MPSISRLMPASPPFSHCFASLKALFRIAIARRSGFLAALFSMPALDSSSARSSLIIAHSSFALRYVAVTDAASESFHWILDHCVSTLVLGGHFPRKEILCFAGTFLLNCLRQEEMISDRWLVRRSWWYVETRKFGLWTRPQKFENRKYRTALRQAEIRAVDTAADFPPDWLLHSI